MFRSALPPIVALILLQTSVHGAPPASHTFVENAPKAARVDEKALKDALFKLEARGIVSDAESWVAKAQPKKFIDAAEVRAVVIAAASHWEPVETIEEAMEILHKNKVLTNAENWNADLMQKAKIGGNVAALLFVSLAQKIN